MKFLVRKLYARQKRSKLNKGKIIRAEIGAVTGWAIGSNFESPVHVALLVNGVEVANAVADQRLKRLVSRGVHPTGCCGFVFRFNDDQMLNVGDKIQVVVLDNGIMQGDLCAEIGIKKA